MKKDMASYDLVLEVTEHSLLSYFTCGSLLRLKRRGHRFHLSVEGVARLYCQSACGMEEIVEVILGKCNLSHPPNSYVNRGFLSDRILAHKPQKLALVNLSKTIL